MVWNARSNSTLDFWITNLVYLCLKSYPNTTPMSHKLDHLCLSVALYEVRLDCFDFFNPGRSCVRKYLYSNATDKKHTMQRINFDLFQFEEKKHTMQRINFYLFQFEERTLSRHNQNIASIWLLKVKQCVLQCVTIWYEHCPWICLLCVSPVSWLK